MISVELCDPQFPPVPIIIGINAVRAIEPAKEFSKDVIIIPVKVAKNISSTSQGILLLKVSKTPVLK